MNDKNYLRELIEQTGLSQNQCAREINIHPRTMRYWLSAPCEVPVDIINAIENIVHREELK